MEFSATHWCTSTIPTYRKGNCEGLAVIDVQDLASRESVVLQRIRGHFRVRTRGFVLLALVM
jgi:hypothetical protein